MYTLTCRECGGTLHRSKRRLFERIRYLEAYRCQGCACRYHVTFVSEMRLARFVKCPKCHFLDVTALKKRDTVDKMRGGLFNLLHRMFAGQLYHCWYCRLQFYDFRARRKNPKDNKDWLEEEPGSAASVRSSRRRAS